MQREPVRKYYERVSGASIRKIRFGSCIPVLWTLGAKRPGGGSFIDLLGNRIRAPSTLGVGRPRGGSFIDVTDMPKFRALLRFDACLAWR
jgi:hypothetical protein